MGRKVSLILKIFKVISSLRVEDAIVLLKHDLELSCTTYGELKSSAGAQLDYIQWSGDEA